MRKIVPIIAGPYKDKGEAFWKRIEAGQWISYRDVRKFYHGWYVLERSRGTVHPGSKKFRRWAKEKSGREGMRNVIGRIRLST